MTHIDAVIAAWRRENDRLGYWDNAARMTAVAISGFVLGWMAYAHGWIR